MIGDAAGTADGAGISDQAGTGGQEPAVDRDAGSYEAARDALADIVRALESGGLPLAESLALWERGEHLAAECERWLAGARARLEAALPPTAR